MMTLQAKFWYERPNLLPEATYVWACQGQTRVVEGLSDPAGEVQTYIVERQHREPDGDIGHCCVTYHSSAGDCNMCAWSGLQCS